MFRIVRPFTRNAQKIASGYCFRLYKVGLFLALSSRSLQPQSQYELAGQMKDLTLGDAHFIPIDDLMQRDVGSDMVCPYFKYTHDMVCICI